MQIKLPDNLKINIATARTRALVTQLLTTILLCIVLFGSSLLLFYLSDRLWETPTFLRVFLQITT